MKFARQQPWLVGWLFVKGDVDGGLKKTGRSSSLHFLFFFRHQCFFLKIVQQLIEG